MRCAPRAPKRPESPRIVVCAVQASIKKWDVTRQADRIKWGDDVRAGDRLRVKNVA